MPPWRRWYSSSNLRRSSAPGSSGTRCKAWRRSAGSFDCGSSAPSAPSWCVGGCFVVDGPAAPSSLSSCCFSACCAFAVCACCAACCSGVDCDLSGDVAGRSGDFPSVGFDGSCGDWPAPSDESCGPCDEDEPPCFCCCGDDCFCGGCLRSQSSTACRFACASAFAGSSCSAWS